MLSTPTRRNRFMLGNNRETMMNDDSPVLSQESIKIAWKWNSEGTPIRPINKTSKVKRSAINFQNFQRLKSKQNNTDGTVSTMSSKLIAEPETHSPKGLYKFQEEMRKIQFYDSTNNDKSIDNLNDISMRETDTGYPINLDGNARYRHSSDNIDVPMMDYNETVQKQSQNDQNHGINDALADDLLNDSDFDQILLTCKMPAQKEATYETVTNHTSVKKASSAPEIKTTNDGSNSSGSNWNLIDDDCFDDLVKDFDVDIPSDSLNTSAKFTRHKSMPQQQQIPSTSSAKMFKPQQAISIFNNNNRKSLTRHESMPITNRPPNPNNNNSVLQNSRK